MAGTRSSTFTTYLNAKSDASLQREFNKLEAVGVSAYSTIARAADSASKASLGLIGGKGTAGLGNATTTALKQRADATMLVGTASTNATRASTNYARATVTEGIAAGAAAKHNQALAQSLQTTARAFSVVQGPLGPVAGRLTAVANAVEHLTGLRLGLVGVAATLFAIGRLGVEYTNVTSRLKPLFDTQTQFNTAFSNVVQIAKDSRQPLQAVADLYSRLTIAGKDVGLSQSRVARLTETASKAATLSGGTRETQQAGLVQFSQAIGRGILGGQDLRAIEEDIPVLSLAIAKGFKNVDGSIGTTVGNLRQLGAEGKTTSLEIADALARSAFEFINGPFSKLPLTLGQASTEFKNAAELLVGGFDQSVGLTHSLASGLDVIARNLNTIVGLIVGVGAGFAAVKIGPQIAEGVAGIEAGFAALQREAALKRGNALQDRQYAIEQAQESLNAVNGTKQRIDGLRQEQVQLAALIEELRVAKVAEDELVGRARASSFGRATIPGGPAVGITTGAAEDRAQAATRALAQAETELKGVSAGLAAEQKLLQVQHGATTVATASMNAVMERAVPSASIATAALGKLRAAGSSLVAFLGGPWGIAFAVATTAFYLLATAESAAEIATRKNEEAQRALANIVDITTGKINEQAGALQVLAARQVTNDNLETQRQNFRTQYNGLVRRVGQFSRNVTTGEFGEEIQNGSSSAAQKRLEAARLRFTQTQDLKQFQNDIVGEAPFIPGLKEALPSFGVQVNQLVAANRAFQQGRAISRIAAGGEIKNGDLAIARGDVSATSVRAAQSKTSLLDQQADAAAKVNSDNQVVAAQGRNKEALLALKARHDASQITDAEYVKERQEIQTNTATEIAGIKQAASEKKHAAAEARAQAKKDARDAMQDRIDAAAAERDNALIALAKGNLNPQSDEYLKAREKILKTYDDEVNKINASKAASHSSAKQILADIEAEKKASAGRSEKRDTILGQYSEEPKAQVKAAENIDKLNKFVDTAVDGVAFLGKTKDEIEAIAAINPLGTGIYTQAMADADAKHIQDGLQKPLDELNRSARRELEVNNLILAGRQDEADALRTAYGLIDQGAKIGQAEYEGLVRQAQQQQHINDLLNSRNRIVSLIQGTVDTTRDAFETFLDDIPTKGAIAGADLLKNLQASFLKINNRQLVEKLFAGSDEKVRALLEGRSEVDTAIHNFADSMSQSETSLSKLTTAYEAAAQRFNDATASIANGTGAAGGGGQFLSGSALTSGANEIASAIEAANAGNAGDIIVSATRTRPSAPVPVVLAPNPSSARVFSSIFESAFGNIFGANNQKTAKLVGDVVTTSLIGSLVGSQFGKNGSAIGGGIGGILQLVGDAAGKGSDVSNAAEALGKGIQGYSIGAAVGTPLGNLIAGKGKRQSDVKTGGAIGGAAGFAVGGPVGAAIGAVLGSIFGGIFATTNRGGALITSGSGAPQIFGNDAQTEGAAGTLAGSVQAGLKQIASSLGVTLGNFAVSIGYFGDKIRVDTSGYTGSLDSKHAPALSDFATTDAAVRFAIVDAIKDGAVKGISQASLNILQNPSEDIDTALQKALTIESIPKRLKAITDPVGAAVDALNTEFQNMIATLTEGGATAAQFADAQKLYDLERAQAVKDATSQAASAIDAFLKDMAGGSSSPLNKKTVYQNAAAQLDVFKSDIASGKLVDQNDLLSAAKNFQDASRNLYGSSASFFDDFNALRDLLSKARDNVGMTDVSTLAPSPFAPVTTTGTSGDTSATAPVTDAINTQTDTLSYKLEQIIQALVANPDQSVRQYAAQLSALTLLPGYGGSPLAIVPATSVG